MTGPTTGEHNLDRIDHAWIKLTHVRHLLEIDGAWRLERQPLQSHLLIFVAGGQGHLSVNGAGHTLASEEAYLVHPGQDVEGDMYPFENKGVYMFTFEMGYTDSAAKRGQLDPPVCVFPLSGSVPVATNAAISLCQSICAHWFATDKLQRLRSQSLIHELLYSLLREQAPPVQESSLAAMMSKAKAYIEQHYREQISFEKLATDAGISSRHFRRLFIAMYGKRPVDYLTELRMNHAKKRMIHPDIQLWEIAHEVGYNDESHFRRAFKGYVGISPALYVKNQHMKIAAYSWPNIGMLLPLNVIPYAAPMDHYWTDFYRDKYGVDVKVRLGHEYSFNRKTLLQARPDRIIAIDDFLPAREQEMLSHFAPVLFIPWRSANWREHLLLTAAFLEKRQQAETWLTHFEQNEQRLTEKVRQLVRREKLLVLMIDRKMIYRWGEAYEGTDLFHTLPLAPARHTDQIEPGCQPVTVEPLSKLEGDRIVMMISEDGASQATWQTIRVLCRCRILLLLVKR